MKYIVYLTTNLKSQINGINRIYIGVHQTENPDIFDGYIGCGVYIQQPSTYKYPKTPFLYAVKKYGTDAFERTVIQVFDSKEEAYAKEKELVNIDFLKQSHVYNACLGGICYNFYKPIYLFNLKGILIKKWDYSCEAYDFYGIPMEKFLYAVFDKHPLVDSLWSNKDTIDITEYSTKPWGSPKVTYLYDKNGKWLREFISRKECANFIGTKEENVVKAITQNSLLAKTYYVSDKLVDVFIPKARKSYSKSIIYVYNKDGVLIGKGLGKEIMSIVKEHSWQTIYDAFRYKLGWLNNTYYLATELVSEVPERIAKNKIKVDVYTKYGDFIETLGTMKEVKLKYGIPNSKLKNIELGNRYFKDWVFKYHNCKLYSLNGN